jgi:hypothetical protein
MVVLVRAVLVGVLLINGMSPNSPRGSTIVEIFAILCVRHRMNSMDAVSTIIMYTSNFGSDNVTILLFTGRAQADRTMMDGWMAREEELRLDKTQNGAGCF